MSATSFCTAFNGIGGQVAVPYTAGSGYLYTNIPSGALQFVTVTNGGSGYTSAPSVSFSGGGGSGATATATIDSNSSTVIGVTLTAEGSGYTSAPSVSFSGGGGSGASAISGISYFALSGSEWARFTAVDLSGNLQSILKVTAVTSSVTSVVVTNGGSSYTSAPSVSFSGGGGSGAAATATLNGNAVSSITMTSYGSGYTSAPSVSFSGGGGSGAAATAYITYKLTISSTLEGTTDVDLPSGSTFEMRITAGTFNDIATAINNLENGGITIGNPVSGGTSKSVLFVDGSGNLAQNNSDFQWDDSAKTFILTTTTNTNPIIVKNDYASNGPAVFLGQRGNSGTGNYIAFQSTYTSISTTNPFWMLGVNQNTPNFAFSSWDGTNVLNYVTASEISGAAGIGFYTSTPVAKQTVYGSRGSNAALASLLTALANLGLIYDSTS